MGPRVFLERIVAHLVNNGDLNSYLQRSCGSNNDLDFLSASKYVLSHVSYVRTRED